MGGKRRSSTSRVALAAAWLLWLAITASASSRPRLVSQVGGACWALDIEGNYAYVGEGPILTILDVSYPSAPAVHGRLRVDGKIIKAVSVSSGVACLSIYPHGLVTVDVSNPARPRVGAYYAAEFLEDIQMVGHLAYVPCRAGLLILDVSDPTSPTLRGKLPFWTHYVYVSGNLAYVMSIETLMIVDVSDPVGPRLLGALNLRNDARDIFVLDGVAYIAKFWGGLITVDVSNPASPTVLARYGSFDVFAYSESVSVSNGVAFIAAYYGLRVVDVTDPSSPTLLAAYDTPGVSENIVLSGDLAYVADRSGGLLIFDVSDPAAPQLRGRYAPLASPTDVVVRDGVAYLADQATGLKLLDVSDPYRPQPLGACPLPGTADQLFVSGDWAYAAQGASGLFIVDVSDPASPTLRGALDTTGTVQAAAVSSDSLAYLADGLGGLRIVDVAIPTSPALLATLPTSATASDVALVSETLICVTDELGLSVVDVRAPTGPVRRSYIPVGQERTLSTRRVFCQGSMAYVTGTYYQPWNQAELASHESKDLSNPDSPRSVGSYDLSPGRAGNIFVVGDLVFVNPYNLEIRRDLGVNWRRMDQFTTYGRNNINPTGGIFVQGDYIYLANGEGGLWILRYPRDPFTAVAGWPLYR